MALVPFWQCVALALLLAVAIKVGVGRRRKLPPGPSGVPILGNLHQMPSRHPERTFYEWSKQYGDVFYVKMLRKDTVVLNTIEAVRDLLDKRSAKYSDRPSMILHGEMIGQYAALVGIPYGERFRKYRKWMYDGVGNKDKLHSYRDLQRREAYNLVRRLLEDPQRFLAHIHLYFAALMLEITYGRRVNSLEDDLVQKAERAVDGTNGLGGPGAQLVDLGFPFLRHVPTWFPGAGFKKRALQVREYVEVAKEAGYKLVMSDLAAGVAGPSVFTSILAEYGGTLPPEEAEDVKGLPGLNVYGAGVETSRGTLTTFFLLIARAPHIACKAQEELDRVIGQDRLPDFEDRESLPYINAILEEVYRYNPVLPLAAPHRVMADDQYRGYDIPAGCTILGNTWAISRDPRFFPEPEDFRPERYLLPDSQKDDILLPSSFVFGYGRRVCPGQTLADPSIWLAIANVLALFDIKKPLDSAGNEYTPALEILPGFTSHPAPFECRVVPRSARTARAISQLVDT